MFIPSYTRSLVTRLMAGALVAVSAFGCGLEKQTAPPLTGPSEFFLSVTLTANPDTLVQDGSSQAVISAVARNAAGEPVPNLTLNWQGFSSNTTLVPNVTFTEQTSVTDSAGRATTGLVSPPAPASVPPTDVTITVVASPVGADFASSTPRQVVVRLKAPDGTPPANNSPVVDFTFSPAAPNVGQTVRFDGSITTDEGTACANCTFEWNFGDFTSGSGVTASHAYTTGGTFNVTLTVTDDRGGVGSRTRAVAVSAPAAPVANIVVSPTQPTAGNAVNFDGGGSTVGAGASIVEYSWTFGDGSPVVTTASAQTSHTFATPATYVVRLTVRDNLGRTATTTANVAVQ